MSIAPLQTFANDYINTNDLAHTSPDGKYSFQFSYLGNGLFFLSSKGHVDENGIKKQLAFGDIARKRLEALSPDKKYHIVWDLSEVSGASLLSRHLIFTKIRATDNFGSVSIINGNNRVINFARILSILIPNIKFLFFRSKEEALHKLKIEPDLIALTEKNSNNFSSIQRDSYGHFIDLWQENPLFLKINNQQYKITSRTNWQYIAVDNSFKVQMSVIEGNIVYVECEGFAKTSGIDATYSILEDIMRELGFNETDNKFYTVVNLKKTKGMSLASRKRALYYEKLYGHRSFMVIMVPSPILQFLFKIVFRISNDEISHWQTIATVDDAVKKIMEHRKGIMFNEPATQKMTKTETPLSIPSTRSEMIRLIRKQHEELVNLKNQQHDQIQKIVEIAGRMTWDESFSPPEITPEYNSPFNEIFNSLSVLFYDFKEIIREKTKHAQKLIESEDKYRNLINLASDLIIVYQGHELKFINSRVYTVLGYDAGEILGKDLDSFIIPSELKRLKGFYAKWMTGEEHPWIYETELIHRNGQLIPVSISVGRIIYEDKPAAMIIARDISQKRKNEEELERYRNHLEEIIKQRTLQLQKEITERKIAEESDRLKTAFLSNMSHEIRTPMNAIISFSNFLKDPELPQKQREEYLNYVQSSGQSLLNLINDIIDISKIESGQLPVQKNYCQVNSLLDELYKLFTEALKRVQKPDVQILISIPENSDNTNINTDPYRLKQILSNLLDNALKFTDKGYIKFGYQLIDNNIEFFVKDTGIGIPDDKKKLIFQRFGKIEHSNRNLSGTGLGLAISQQLSTLLNGSLWLESKEGIGTTFYLQLPYLHSDLPITVTTSLKNQDKKHQSNWKGRKLLIAEDEELNFKVLQIALKKTGAEILRAHDGSEAIEVVKMNPDICAILMDIQMPIMDGYEAMVRIKRLYPNLPVIAQTAFAMLEEQKKCIEKGFDDYVTKPIKIDELISKIDSQLNHSL